MKLWPFKSKPAVDAKSLIAPEDWLLEIFGASTTSAGVSVSSSAALFVPAVNSAVRLISEAAASLDIRVMRMDAEGAKEDREHPVAKLLHGDVNDWTSAFELVRDLVSMALTHDQGGLAWVNRVDNKPAEIIRYEAGIISVEYRDTGEPTYRTSNGLLKPADIIHVRGPFTRCPVTLAREAIGVAIILERHASKFFANGARPSGVLETPRQIGDEGVKKLLKGWKAAQQGADNAGKTPLLWDGTTYRPLTMSSTDAQFLELRKYQVMEIARAFRVPPSMLYELDRATWSNSEQMGREFLTYTLEPWLLALENALGRALFTREERATYRILFDRDDLTRADIGARATAYSSLISSRVLNPNEARAWEGLPPYEGGDQFANPNTGANQPGAAAPQKQSEAANAA